MSEIMVHSPQGAAHTQPGSAKTVADILTAKTRRLPTYRTVRDRMWLAGLRACHYCARKLTLERECTDSATVDHKTPISRGGANAAANYALACWACNQVKGDMTEAEFSAAILAELDPAQ